MTFEMPRREDSDKRKRKKSESSSSSSSDSSDSDSDSSSSSSSSSSEDREDKDQQRRSRSGEEKRRHSSHSDDNRSDSSSRKQRGRHIEVVKRSRSPRDERSRSHSSSRLSRRSKSPSVRGRPSPAGSRSSSRSGQKVSSRHSSSQRSISSPSSRREKDHLQSLSQVSDEVRRSSSRSSQIDRRDTEKQTRSPTTSPPPQKHDGEENQKKTPPSSPHREGEDREGRSPDSSPPQRSEKIRPIDASPEVPPSDKKSRRHSSNSSSPSHTPPRDDRYDMSKYEEESGASESEDEKKGRKKKHDMRNFESEPESGECTDSEDERRLKSSIKTDSIPSHVTLGKTLIQLCYRKMEEEDGSRRRGEGRRGYSPNRRRDDRDGRRRRYSPGGNRRNDRFRDDRPRDRRRSRDRRNDRDHNSLERRKDDDRRRSPTQNGSKTDGDKDKATEENQKEGEKAENAAKKSKEAEVLSLTTRTGGAYIPPARLRAMQASITDKSSEPFQRIAWEALKKSINGLINKVNVSNLHFVVQELFQENIVRGRGLVARSVIQAQSASPTFTHVYAALVSVINTKFPQIGELILRRLVIQFRRGFKRNDKNLCLSSTRFIAHLVNQQVAHEVLALEILTLLLETPSDDSVEVAVGFLKECGQKLTEVTPRGITAIFERLRNVLHEGQIDVRVQYMIEVMFAIRKDGFKDHQSVIEELDLISEEDQFTHLLTLEDEGTAEEILNVFKFDPEYEANEEKYKELKKEILDEGSSDEESGSGSGSESDSDEEEGEGEEGEKQTIIDQTETNLIALRRTIYLTIQSALDFEECAHKLLRMELKPGQEVELCNMILDCCAQQRTYEKFFGLLAQNSSSVSFGTEKERGERGGGSF
ncbi:pre-mRNA-splicing factor CWC22 homolog [Saccostrea cucullata]|uniref:pre-mRNA-splicing factor CWC22 homolog n=1 Tax=Saccostrea cuccullata TaxID=36930 RepID=UPI002ED1176A